jgi:hypothetical protein
MPPLRQPTARPNLTERIDALAAPLSLAERVEQLHAEIDALVDAHVEAEAKATPGVPAVRIRHDLMTKMSWCRCEAAKHLEKTS